jgi:hypothetical protein
MANQAVAPGDLKSLTGGDKVLHPNKNIVAKAVAKSLLMGDKELLKHVQ